MKSLAATLLIVGLFAGCHKNDGSCDQTMAAISGQYKLTKSEHVAYGPGTSEDVTASLTVCQLSAIYTLNTDSTINYAEPGNCTGSGTGRWKIDTGMLYPEMNSGSSLLNHPTMIESWDCRTLVLISLYPSVDYNDRLTLTKL